MPENSPKLVVHYGASEDRKYEWEELVFQKADGSEEFISQIRTHKDLPDENSLSRIGRHNFEKLITIIKANPSIEIEFVRHIDQTSYLG